MDSDTDKAARLNWLRLAAEQGHVEAMYALGMDIDAGNRVIRCVTAPGTAGYLQLVVFAMSESGHLPS